MRARRLVLAAALGFAAVGAAPAAPAGARDKPWSWADLDIKGTLTYKGFAHFDEAPNENRHFRNEGILELEWARKFSEWSSLRLLGDARVDDNNFADGVHFQIPETTKRRSILNLREGVLRLRGGPMELTLGKQVFAWGTADAVNPTDYLNPWDFLDILDRRQLGIYSAAYTLVSGPVSHTIVVVPVFTPSRDPLLKGRWAPQAPEGPPFILDDREVPDGNTFQWAGRMKLTVNGLDVAVSYYDGFDNTPVLRESTVAVGPLPVRRLTPVYSTIKAVGTDFSTTWRKFEFHGEAAYRMIESRGRDDRLQWVLGLNYTFDELPVKWLERVEAILEYSRENILDKRAHSQYGPSTGFFSAAFGNALTGRLRFKFTEETQFAISGSANFASGPASYYTQLKLTHKLTDALHAEGGFDFLGGPDGSVWGQWERNDRAFVTLKYFF